MKNDYISLHEAKSLIEEVYKLLTKMNYQYIDGSGIAETDLRSAWQLADKAMSAKWTTEYI